MSRRPARTFRERDPIRIGLIGLCVLALAVIAALRADDIPIIGGGTTYSADFSEAAGLTVDDEVRIAGVKVGRVRDIAVEGDHVKVEFKVRDAWLGDLTTAAIKIKTLLGRKYLALDPQGTTALDPAESIPRARTTAPYDVLEAFQGLSATLGAVDTNQLARSFDTLSRTFSDTPADVRGALSGLSRLSDTIATRDGQLSRLLGNTERISRTLADHDAEVARLVRDGNTLLAEVATRKQAISALLDGTRTLATELRGLVDDNSAQLDPVLAQLDQLTGMLRRNQGALGDGVRKLAPMLRMFTNVAGSGRWVDGYICGLVLPSFGPINPNGCMG